MEKEKDIQTVFNDKPLSEMFEDVEIIYTEEAETDE